MKVKIIKPHFLYKGEVDLPESRANYLVKTGMAEKPKAAKIKKPKAAKIKK